LCPLPGVYQTAREYLERALVQAEARGDRQLARTIAVRICEVIEQEDYHECRLLHER